MSRVTYPSYMASYAPAPSSTRSPAGLDRVRGFIFVGAMVLVMWVLEALDVVGAGFDSEGIHPRDVDGLDGIVFAPFLHAGWGHLIGNTAPFVVLGATIALSGLARTAAVTGIVALVGGSGRGCSRPRTRTTSAPAGSCSASPPT